MSARGAIVRSPPSTGFQPESEPEPEPVPPPQAARATVATAAIPVNLNRVDRVIDCLIVPPRRGEGERCESAACRSHGTGGTAGFPGGVTVAFVTAGRKRLIVVTFVTA